MCLALPQKTPVSPALNLVSGHIVVKIPSSPALNLVFAPIVAKNPLSPALKSIFAPIVVKSLDREDKTFLHHYLKQKKQGEMLCFFVSG